MADVAAEVNYQDRLTDFSSSKKITIGLLVGSKPAKLSQGVPLCMAIAESVERQQPKIEFIIPVAPTLDLDTLSKYANRRDNPLISVLGNVEGKLITAPETDARPYLLTSGGTKLFLITQFPAYQQLVNCQLCLTTVGANTADH